MNATCIQCTKTFVRPGDKTKDPKRWGELCPECRPCPDCGKGPIITRMEEDPIVYGADWKRATIPCTVPVRRCTNCGFEFLDYVAEDIREEAIRRYLDGK